MNRLKWSASSSGSQSARIEEPMMSERIFPSDSHPETGNLPKSNILNLNPNPPDHHKPIPSLNQLEMPRLSFQIPCNDVNS